MSQKGWFFLTYLLKKGSKKMITLLFIILMFTVFTKILVFAFKAAWGLAKIIVSLVLLPVILIALAVAGFIYLALAILIVVGLITLISSLVMA